MLLKEPKIRFGVAEDVISDPLKLGRIRVRIFHHHSEKKEISGERGIPTEDLPWAVPCPSVNDGAMTGIGTMPSSIVQGTEVIILVRDDLYQDLQIIGVVPGIHQTPAKPAEGFYDPEGLYPLVDRLEEPDTHRMARLEKLDETILLDKVERINRNIPIANRGDWSEPLPIDYYKPEYPFNKVTETVSGHHMEIDDTEGFERIHTWHKSGAYDEVINTGERIIKVPSNFYITVEDDHFNIFVKSGGVHITAMNDIRMKSIAGAISLESLTGIKLHTLGTVDVDATLGINQDSPIIVNNSG